MSRAGRVTIADVAAMAGVSKMTVSLTMNERPGVSDETRRRVREAAERLGWEPDQAARTLAGSAAGAFGLVLRREAREMASDTFYMELIAALTATLSSRQHALTMSVVSSAEEEAATYRSLARRRLVTAVLVTDVERDDPRAELLASLHLPAVALGGPATQFATLCSDDSPAVVDLVAHLAERGHRRIGRMGGSGRYYYPARRTEDLVAAAAERNLRVEVLGGAEAGPDAERGTVELVDRGATAIVYDSASLALGGVVAARRAGWAIPSDLAVVAWDGAGWGEALAPRLTAIQRDVGALGEAAAHALLRGAGAGLPVGPLDGGADVSAPRLVIRAST